MYYNYAILYCSKEKEMNRDKAYSFPINFKESEVEMWEQFRALCNEQGHSLTWKLKDMIRREVALNQGDEHESITN